MDHRALNRRRNETLTEMQKASEGSKERGKGEENKRGKTET